MVNEDFKRELKQLFSKGLEDSLTPGTDASRWSFKDRNNSEDIQEEEFFVLTVSSQLFRVFVLLHFTRSPNTEAFVSEVLKTGNNALDTDKFYDYLGEVGNAFCGAIKRDLNRIVPSLGMSTPNRLGKDCLKYMTSLKVDYEAHSLASYDDNPLFYASIYLSADEELHYDVNSVQASDDDVDSGELEFF